MLCIRRWILILMRTHHTLPYHPDRQYALRLQVTELLVDYSAMADQYASCAVTTSGYNIMTAWYKRGTIADKHDA